ncbi:NAD(P)-dependent oxidoreductase [Ktedonosporobacter rubrisoli]|uniref:NAD(P)-dependent oxidoreductase n=1 Tax=Ktedonosporobacter rubrisoli TaxID=2509675 RepID=A0A4P6JLA3_KTERU|nr:NAD(P)-dependent oxidoreductase [Ktedonosporobacter rubrisoli]QBD75772.1 NAD(P)-dependent oxidoreductase [Ktedonosporobacter rubrisoli]
MKIHTVALLSPGDMGHAIAADLHQHSMNVITNLHGRSERTRSLARTAGINEVPDDETLVREADILLSIMPPANAYALGERIGAVLQRSKTELLFVDCNAIAPRTAQALDKLLTEAGAAFVDGGIIGGPPRSGQEGPHLYVSGTRAADVALLNEYGLDVRVVGSQPGQASGLKMCYASVTKGLTALATEALVAGRALGLQEALLAELQDLPVFASLKRSVPGMPPKAYRWVGEMQEIARTFADLGLPPQMPEGAAALYSFVESTELGLETPEQRQRGQTLEEVAEILAAALQARQA